MDRRESIKEALAHHGNGKTPYAINFTTEALELYGERLLSDYAPEKVLTDYLTLTKIINVFKKLTSYSSPA